MVHSMLIATPHEINLTVFVHLKYGFAIVADKNAEIDWPNRPHDYFRTQKSIGSPCNSVLLRSTLRCALHWLFGANLTLFRISRTCRFSEMGLFVCE